MPRPPACLRAPTNIADLIAQLQALGLEPNGNETRDVMVARIWCHKHGIQLTNLNALRSYGLHTSNIDLKKYIHERLVGRGLAAEILRKLPQLEDKDALVTIICLLDGKIVIYTPASGIVLLSFKPDHREFLDDIEMVYMLNKASPCDLR